ncbi:tRNA pseudouridine(55) synthase TruB [Allofrancisella frigidaquae]|uniref:tRNA pseudouridine synthase B n=1 Tax=Allofrancisella frigidaquae TaxID=1085644 RepID=A0A6M3HSG5_9GAMM|nr:tRNA pseudouridine(55) synthase TruB [Allofrancisella frigidaquae]QIV94103.1 tRNA pseudouridine(55) synthase TruB [Allofrancisella frigidaquae]
MKKNKLNLNGIIVINKAKGISSNKILQQLKYLYNAKKAGHTGTLDPMATGVLPICFGRATKIAQYLLDADKEYIATIKLGIQTTTGDAEGEIVTILDVPKLSNTLIENILDKFRGQSDQTPPIYSALKYNGQPLYKLAREGKQVEIRPRKITIYQLKLLSSKDDTLEIKVRCSKGTYIRSLAMDIGTELGCGGHLIALQRTQSGPFSLDKAYEIEGLKDLSFEEKLDTIEHIESVFKDKPIYTLDVNQKHDLYNKGILTTQADINGVFRIYDENKFIAVAEFDKGNLVSKKFFEQEKLISE